MCSTKNVRFLRYLGAKFPLPLTGKCTVNAAKIEPTNPPYFTWNTLYILELTVFQILD